MIGQSIGYRWQESMLILNLYIQPNARKEGVDGIHGDRIKIRISAPAVDNKANQKLVALLANTFAVPKSAIQLTKGDKSRHKTVVISQPRELPSWIAK